MRKKLLIGITPIVVILMLALNPIAFAQAANSAQAANNEGVGAAAGTTYDVNIAGEGTYFFTESTLYALSDRDTFKVTLTTRVRLTVVLADGYLMGDTIGIFHPNTWTLKGSAKSPNMMIGGAVVGPGTVTFYVGYTACPGGFSAGYFIWIIATHA